ncbi:uncharacterized protein LOC130537472 [Takifugu flavidus]|uniref:uncharacterized protein LOC130537472 n=1 Tax=Takifugu flavidus TaxID=433684 RepID=UPI00254435D3|nr:uncharacterized protein LOC130537472 [Takifugu flavidus]
MSDLGVIEPDWNAAIPASAPSALLQRSAPWATSAGWQYGSSENTAMPTCTCCWGPGLCLVFPAGGVVEQLALWAGAPVGNCHLATYLACLAAPECCVAFVFCPACFPARLRSSCCLLDRRACRTRLPSSLQSWRTASVPQFSAVQEDCFCSRTHPCSLQSWRTASVPKFSAVLEDCFCSRVLCSPGGLLLFPSYLQSWRTASVPSSLQSGGLLLFPSSLQSGRLLLFPSSRQFWRTASVPEFSAVLEDCFCSRFSAVLEDCFCSRFSAILEDCFCLLCLHGAFEVFMPSAGPVSVPSRTPEFSAVQEDCLCLPCVVSPPLPSIKLILDPLTTGFCLKPELVTPVSSCPGTAQLERLLEQIKVI